MCPQIFIITFAWRSRRKTPDTGLQTIRVMPENQNLQILKNVKIQRYGEQEKNCIPDERITDG